MSPVAVILGFGSNIGRATASKLKAEGYKVAVASRTVNTDEAKANGYFPLTADLAKTASVESVFNTVVKELGVPTLVVYNASQAKLGPADDPFAPSLADLETANAVNISSFYSTVQQFVKHGRTLPAETQKTVFYTGNILNTNPMPKYVTAGVGKAAAAHIVAVGAGSPLVKEGFRFYYADERTPEGAPVINGANGPAHAEIFSRLSKEKEQKPWNVLFLKSGQITQF